MTAHTVLWFEVLCFVKMAGETAISHGLIAVGYVTGYAVRVGRLIVEPFRGDRVTCCAFVFLLLVVGIMAV